MTVEQRAADGVLIDLDGTLVRGGRPVPGSPELIRSLGRRAIVVSNNSSHTPADLSEQLSRLGIDISPPCLLLAGDVALRTLRREYADAAVLLCANEAMTEHAAAMGIQLVLGEGRPDIVLLTRDDTFTYKKLCRAVDAVRSGARLVAANPDLTHPGLEGRVVPETGALLQSLLACPGVEVHLTIGKPEPFLLLEGARRLGRPISACVMVGDNPATDGVGAKRLGMRCLLVDPGVPGFNLYNAVLDWTTRVRTH